MTATESSPRPRAVVTGASSGIGQAFAERLAGDGYDLVVVARRRDRLEALAKRLGEQHGAAVDVLVADLTDPAALATVERRVAGDPALVLLVNNAGFGGYMPFVDLEPDQAEALIRLHILAVTRLTRAALPAMLARGRGAIINVSSQLAFSASMSAPTLPKRAVYVGAKAYLNAFTETLAHELVGTGVQVQVLCPGIVQTEFHEIVGRDITQLPAQIVASPAHVVQASLAGLRLGEIICVPTLSDTAVLQTSQASQRAVFDSGRTATLAPRYLSES